MGRDPRGRYAQRTELGERWGAALERSYEAAIPRPTTARRPPPVWEPPPTFSVEHLFATGSHAARTNARLGKHGIVF